MTAAPPSSVSTFHPAPDIRLTVDGIDITPRIEPRLIRLCLTECRGESADQLDLQLSDHDGRLALPRKDAVITVELGWAGEALIDKGAFTVDEVEHCGAPDTIGIRARSADMVKGLRIRSERSWHGTTIAAIVGAIAGKHGLAARVDPALGATAVDHVDQTNESDLSFVSRLARQYDAVATVKHGQLLFLPINGTTTSSGQPIGRIHIDRTSGDQHRYHTASRDAYSGVVAYWHDPTRARRRGAIVGARKHAKRLKDTYGSERDALRAARAEWQRLERGAATFELALAHGRPDIAPQTPVTVAGFKPEIDGQDWLVKRATHELQDGGLTSRMEMERGGSPDQADATVEDVREPE